MATSPPCRHSEAHFCCHWRIAAQRLPSSKYEERFACARSSSLPLHCMLICYDHTVHMSHWEGFGTLLVATDNSNALPDPVLYGAYTVCISPRIAGHPSTDVCVLCDDASCTLSYPKSSEVCHVPYWPNYEFCRKSDSYLTGRHLNYFQLRRTCLLFWAGANVRLQKTRPLPKTLSSLIGSNCSIQKGNKLEIISTPPTSR